MGFIFTSDKGWIRTNNARCIKPPLYREVVLNSKLILIKLASLELPYHAMQISRSEMLPLEQSTVHLIKNETRKL